eukprot:2214358-Rhodomonas_salina.1
MCLEDGSDESGKCGWRKGGERRRFGGLMEWMRVEDRGVCWRIGGVVYGGSMELCMEDRWSCLWRIDGV